MFDRVISVTKNITNQLKNAFPDKITYPILGNYDAAREDQLPLGPSPLYEQIGGGWV